MPFIGKSKSALTFAQGYHLVIAFAKRTFKTKTFARWMRKEGLGDTELILAAREIIHGQFEADLGGKAYKKRVPLPGRGKRGSPRTLIAYGHGCRVVLVFGYAKGERANISSDELSALRLMAKTLLDASDAEKEQELSESRLIEVKNHGQ